MNFFSFPAEIRLQIYEELLVSSEPIKFKTTEDSEEPSLPLVVLFKRHGLCPAALRASKKVHSEAIELLYTRNRFEFIDLIPTERLRPTDSTAVEYFLNQIGRSNASLLRRICIDFPDLIDNQPRTARLHEDSIRTLELVRENCTGLTILETPLDGTFQLEYHRADTSLEFYNPDTGLPGVADVALELIDSSFRKISSLQEIIVLVYTTDEDKDLDDDEKKTTTNELLQKMRGYGWTTRFMVLDAEEEKEEESEDDSNIDSDDFHGIEMEEEDNGSDYDY